VVVTLHDLGLAARSCDRIVVVDRTAASSPKARRARRCRETVLDQRVPAGR
jgi:ABC-type hemin transport system ATPase subunit